MEDWNLGMVTSSMFSLSYLMSKESSLGFVWELAMQQTYI